MRDQLAEPDFITVSQDARLIGHEALTVEMRAIRAVEVCQDERFIKAFNGGVNTRDAFLDSLERGEVDVGFSRVLHVVTTEDNLCLRIQDERLGKVAHVEDDVRIVAKTRRSPTRMGGEFARRLIKLRCRVRVRGTVRELLPAILAK